MPSLAALATRWYAANARDLPWRAPGVSPWAVLVSEVMLQQTQVSRVLPAYRDWMRRWPTPADLAAETPAEAIRAWGRLGYPRRALRLHECARVLVVSHGGAVPADVESLLTLPGIGAYTARAVAAFAFRQRHPVVDTNVRRLVARAVTGAPDGGPSTTAADLVTVAALLPVRAESAARASVAFMELGALICTARSPACELCPLAGRCAWRGSAAGSAAGRGSAAARGSAPGSAAGHGSAAVTAGPDRPARRSQRFAGTDRQVRGLLMAVLRDSPGPVPAGRLDLVWPDPVQRGRALAGLVADGLACVVEPDRYALPG